MEGGLERATRQEHSPEPAENAANDIRYAYVQDVDMVILNDDDTTRPPTPEERHRIELAHAGIQQDEGVHQVSLDPTHQLRATQSPEIVTPEPVGPEVVDRPEMTEAPPIPVGKLRFSAGDNGLVFFNSDGVTHVISDPDEELRLHQAVAHFMATREQTPGLPELELAMLGPDGQPVIAPESTSPIPEPSAPAPEAASQAPASPEAAPIPNTTGVPVDIELDPARFTRANNSANWTGRGEQGDFYEHPDAPGVRFSATQIDALRHQQPPQDRQQQRNPEAAPSGTAAIFESARDVVRRNGWDIDPKNYIGLTPKPLREILHGDPKDAQLFGEMVMAIDPSKMSIFERAVAGGELTPEDRKFVTYAQFEYAKRLNLGEVAGGYTNASDLELFMRRNPEIRQNVLLNGVEQTLAGLKEEMLHLAMRDPERVMSLNDSYASLKDDRSTARYENWDAKIRSICEKGRIDPKDYEAMFDLNDRAGTRDRLQEQVRKDMSAFGRAADWTFGLANLSKADRLLKAAETLNLQTQKTIASPTSWVLSRVNEQLDSVTRVMAYTITNPAFQNMLTTRAFTNQEVGRPTDAGPKTITQMRDASAARAREYSAENLNRWFDRDKATYRTFDGRGWDQMRPEEKIDFRDNVWSPPESHDRSEGLSIWALIASALARALFGQRKREAIPAT